MAPYPIPHPRRGARAGSPQHPPHLPTLIAVWRPIPPLGHPCSCPTPFHISIPRLPCRAPAIGRPRRCGVPPLCIFPASEGPPQHTPHRHPLYLGANQRCPHSSSAACVAEAHSFALSSSPLASFSHSCFLSPLSLVAPAPARQPPLLCCTTPATPLPAATGPGAVLASHPTVPCFLLCLPPTSISFH